MVAQSNSRTKLRLVEHPDEPLLILIKSVPTTKEVELLLGPGVECVNIAN
jgi:hypothetical protein